MSVNIQSTKRTDYISWDEYFMGVAILAAKRSKDPNTQVGACIVDKNNIILSTGYNCILDRHRSLTMNICHQSSRTEIRYIL